MPILTLGFSPCPNDTFIFDALVNKKIDTQGIDFEIIMADVEQLNQQAFAGTLNITKLSYHALGHLLPTYQLLHAGSALGNNCGPLLIASKTLPKTDIPNCRIAIPGKYTTANFLLGLAFPDAKEKVEMLFSDIEAAVLQGKAEAGLIIHENRFTYQEKGLIKLIDLGEFWETTTGLPIPLGGIAIQRHLPDALKKTVDALIRQSIEYAFANPDGTTNYVRQYAQEMDEAVLFQHIGLYVNDFSVDLGEKGRQAVQHLFDMAWERNLIPAFDGAVFVPK